jgi:uncharacterized protein YjiS (DUF1127 family)
MSEQFVHGMGPSLGPPTGRLYRRYVVSNTVSSLFQRLPVWIARRRQRRALAELGEHLLYDIGVSKEAARRETAKPFWR